ncbi:hypothetical protein [Paraflavitalea speifideaquila]|uniref:hypothetical protein n=1 Tax=Paraflavitalea speifideaquila TaxID=3076558 RepID=UPI0028EE0836|nr:hypothetical protein [Paraflavitalea speifideiaquila]
MRTVPYHHYLIQSFVFKRQYNIQRSIVANNYFLWLVTRIGNGQDGIFPATVILNLPSSAVTVPLVIPFSTTDAPETG